MRQHGPGGSHTVETSRTGADRTLAAWEAQVPDDKDDFDDLDDLEDASPGWDAIDEALERLYGDTEPLHYGTLLAGGLSLEDAEEEALDGISAYSRVEPVPHWHIISYGMSELYEPVEDDGSEPDLSGWGFEFTFRPLRDPSEDEPPEWALSFVDNLAKYVWSSRRPFAPGHVVDAKGPIAQERRTSLHAAAFTLDAELRTIDTPNGRVTFLQIVGITREELTAFQAHGPETITRLLDAFSRRLPLLTTDLTRGPLLDDPEVARLLEQTRPEG